MASVTQLGYIGIAASNVPAWEAYAQDILGLQVSGREADGTLYLRMDENHHRFAIHPNGNDDLAYLGWEVAGEGELRAMAERLRAEGFTVAEGTAEEIERRRVTGLVKYTDPNDVPCEVYYGPVISFENPFKSPRAISGFVTGDQGLGHMVLFVKDLNQSMHYYRDVLGFKISDYIAFEMAPGFKPNIPFFHCNPRHHTVALVAAPAPKKIHHFMVQLKNQDDIGSTYYMVQDKGIEITSSLGKHTNDHMYSFYMRNPSGFEIEWGHGGREVDDNNWQVVKHEAASIWGHRPLAAAH